jgi:hypothetical protein
MNGTNRTATFWISMALLSGFVLSVAPLATAAAPAQEDSLAAVARKSREQKKAEGGKTSKVWDNDNVPTSGVISVVGPSATSSDATAAADQSKRDANASHAPLSREERASLQRDVDSAKQELEFLKADLQILQRKYALDQQSYYSKTNYLADKDGAAALESEKAQLGAKQQEVDEAQKHLDEAQAHLAAASSAPESK